MALSVISSMSSPGGNPERSTQINHLRQKLSSLCDELNIDWTLTAG